MIILFLREPKKTTSTVGYPDGRGCFVRKSNFFILKSQFDDKTEEKSLFTILFFLRVYAFSLYLYVLPVPVASGSIQVVFEAFFIFFTNL